jgi:DNA polymerase
MKNTLEKAEAFLQMQMQIYGPVLFAEPMAQSAAEQKAQAPVQSSTMPGPDTNRSTDTIMNEQNQLPMQNAPARTLADGALVQKKDNLFGAETWMNAPTLDTLCSQIQGCLKCPLGHTRNKFVFGAGNPNADIMVIGEAPGADEDASGQPFVGAAGQLLTKILEAIGFKREEVYIANIIKCRPPGNRRPEKSETDQCEPYLLRQIELIKPRFILAVGLTAATTLLKKDYKMSEIRGRFFDYHGVQMLVTYHPAALLRNPNWKKPAWEDVQLLRKMYDEYKSNASPVAE